MKLHIQCAYCSQLVTYVLKASDEMTLKGRSLTFDDKMKCPTCDSVTSVEIVTKRKSKGKRMREFEAKAEEANRLAIRAKAVINKKIGDALLAQPGCTCAESAKHRGEGTHRGEPSGHPLSTGWSRDPKTGHTLPTIPKHYYHCPLNGTAEEQLAIDVIFQEETK